MKLTFHYVLTCILFLVISSIYCNAQEINSNKQQNKSNETLGPKQPVPLVPSTKSVDVILGKPTHTTMTFNILKYDEDASMSIYFGIKEAELLTNTQPFMLKQNKPLEITLENLKPNTQYFYELRDSLNRKEMVKGTFHTQRTLGEKFVFTITADSHLDQNTDINTYKRTLSSALSDKPDFHIDLGDTFMTDKHESKENATKQYLAQRIYLSLLGKSAPLYLVLGNHDGEHSKLSRGGSESLAVWSNQMRKQYFSNPIPNNFYLGNGIKDTFAGLLQDYYAWEWGNTLFVVLNPFWYANNQKSDDRWNLSLGLEQYTWLKKTLEHSHAKFKLIFIHQLIGGIDKQGRGGVEAIPFGEWGGKNSDGNDGFKLHRSGWELPIHQLLVRNHVDIVFHGHDHLFAKQELDGIIYQEVPQPAHLGAKIPKNISEYGYQSGVILGGSGYMRVGVSPHDLLVDFVGYDSNTIHSYAIKK